MVQNHALSPPPQRGGLSEGSSARTLRSAPPPGRGFEFYWEHPPSERGGLSAGSLARTLRCAPPNQKLQFYGNMGLRCRFSIGNVVAYVNATQACWWHLGGGDRRVLAEDLAVKSAPK